MLAALLIAFAASSPMALPDAPASSQPRAIDRVMSETPRLDATDPDDALTDKMIRACLDAHGGDATLCRARVTKEQQKEVPRHQVEEQKDRLDPTGERPR